jgi:hypothetical protein
MTAPNTPIWLRPSVPGQLSNGHGANAIPPSLGGSGEGIGFQARMSTPKGATSPLSLVRLLTYRSGVGGNASASQPAWDSGWIGGAPAVQQLLKEKQACGGNCSVSYNGRLYFMPSDGTLVSFPVSSAAIGTPRYESPVPAGTSSAAPLVYSLTNVGNRLYCTASITSFISTLATLYTAPINADGTVGSWIPMPSMTASTILYSDSSWKNTGLLGGWDGSSTTGWIVMYHSGTTPSTLKVNIADGSITTIGVNAAATVSVARDNLTATFIASTAGVFHIFYVGGTAAAATASIDKIAISANTGLMTGGNTVTTAANGSLPVARTGGCLIVLQNGTVYYMGGSSGITAAGATSTVYYAKIDNVFNNSAGSWLTSAQVLPAATWLAGGDVVMPDYDLLSSTTRPADSATEVITLGGSSLVANLNTMAIASFRAATTIALRGGGGLGALATGTNTAVTPAYGAAGAPVLNDLLVAWVSGSDQTTGGATNLGATGAATSSWDWSGVNADNEVFTDAVITVPAGGIYINKISVYMGGHTVSVGTKLCVWNRGSGALIVSGAQTTYGVGRALRTQSVASTFVAAGTTLCVGFWRDKSKDAEWGVAASGTFRYKSNQSAPGSISGFSTCAPSYICGSIQAYVTYSTLTTSPITASAGWVKAADSANNSEEVQIWYKVAAGGDAAPTFSSTQGVTPMHAQLAEFTGAVTVTPADAAGTFKQGAASVTMSVTASAADFASTDLILTASRWSILAVTTATFTNAINNATNVHAGDTGAGSLTRQSSFNYGIGTAGLAPTRAPGICLIGGQQVGGAPTTAVYGAAVIPSLAPSDIQPWSSVAGPGTSASDGNLGDNGGLNSNADGTQDVTIQYGAPNTVYYPSGPTGAAISVGTSFIASFNDGDQITAIIQFVGLDGDPSPIATTVVVIGQPPQAIITTPTGAGPYGLPDVAFAYNAGLGGGPQATWRAQIIGAITGTIIADSGARTDQSNFWEPQIAPMLSSAVDEATYNVSVTVSSIDTPMDAFSTDTNIAVVNFSTVGAAPAPPTGLLVTTSAVFCGCVLSWINPASSTDPVTNRIYYRRTGTSPWILLRDMVTAGGHTSMFITHIDRLAMGGVYDFAVTTVDATGQLESVMSSALQFTNERTGVMNNTHNDPLNNVNALQNLQNPGSLAANILTMSASGSVYTLGHMDWDDGQIEARFKWVTAGVFKLIWHCGSRTNTATNAILAYADGVNIYFAKYVGGAFSTFGSVPAALVNGTFYWLRLANVGTTYTISIFNDGASITEGTLLAATTAVIPDSALQIGCAGIANESATIQVGGASANSTLWVRTMCPAGWSPFVRGVGNTDFGSACWSKVNPHTDLRSLSFYSPTANAYGFWGSSNIATITGVPLAVSAFTKGPTSSPASVFYLGTDNVTVGATFQPNWALSSNVITPTSTGNQSFLLLHGTSGQITPGTYYWDDISVNIAAGSNITIPTPTGGYTGMLHIPGSLTLYAPIYLVGGPSTSETLESSQAQVAGSAAPIVRIGEGDWRELELTIQQHLSTDFGPLETILAAMRNGQSAYLRTAAGHMLQVALKSDLSIEFLPSDYLAVRTIKLGIVQVPDVYLPSLDRGIGRGLLTQIAGATPVLDPSELAL